MNDEIGLELREQMPEKFTKVHFSNSHMIMFCRGVLVHAFFLRFFVSMIFLMFWGYWEVVEIQNVSFCEVNLHENSKIWK